MRGLSSAEALERLERWGPNSIGNGRSREALQILADQFRSPLVLILIAAASVSAMVQAWLDAAIVITVVVFSALLGFWQEYHASVAVEELRARVSAKTTVVRDGNSRIIPSTEVVPGDLVLLSAGSLIPADGRILEAKDFFVTQSVLTGETFPVEKFPGEVAAHSSLAQRTNFVFMGTSVRSGTASVEITETGLHTIFGQIAERLKLRPPENEFERGLRHFGYLLTQVVLFLVLGVFAINVFLAKPPVDSLLFAIALAVGISPELLPAIIAVTLAGGAQDMAKRGVIVRRLNRIENFGSMDVLCSDKTGTLTEGSVKLDRAVDKAGSDCSEVALLALVNACLQRGMENPLDEAIVRFGTAHSVRMDGWEKLDEIPYDFVRKRLSVAVRNPENGRMLITKGALEPVMEICTGLDEDTRADLYSRFRRWSEEGYRVLGVATKKLAEATSTFTRGDEVDMAFAGFLLFFDPPKDDAGAAISELQRLGVDLKIISGDNRLVTAHLAGAVGLRVEGVITGSELDEMRDEALWHLAEKTTIFAEVDPNQKERIIRALQKTGHVVGYLGDGINDAPALHAADVGISVESAVDVAKEAADFVLLKHDLGVLSRGIRQGRRTFANTIKYIFTTTSANFGNMLSMAGASLFLPFLPLLAKQILLNNFLSDIPGMAIASDNVDEDWLDQPRRWDMHFIRNFMIVFGLVSSVFDYLTFGALVLVFRASPEEFRTAWFIESLLTELVIALIVRTRLPFYRSRPGTLLLVSTVVLSAFTLALPYLPYSGELGFQPLPLPLISLVAGLLVLYIAAAEIAKRYFYLHWTNRRRGPQVALTKAERRLQWLK